MFANNRTLDWLLSKDDNERDKLIKEASKKITSLKHTYRERTHEIENNRRKSRKNENLQRKRLQKQENSTKEIIHHGLWQLESEVDNMLESYQKPTQKIEAFKAQLKFRKEVYYKSQMKRTCLMLQNQSMEKEKASVLTNLEQT